MRQVDLRSQPDREWLTEPYTTFFESEHVDRAVIFAANHLRNRSVILSRITGTPGFEAELTASPLVHSAAVHRITDSTFVTRLHISQAGTLGEILRPYYDHDAVIVLPIVIGNGEIRYRVVGSDRAIGSLLDLYPDQSQHDVLRLSRDVGGQFGQTSSLTERQRTVVETALELGYYDSPRGATHADIAAELGCSPSNVSVHLQKAESKVMSAAFAA